jgi:hypothetical protein
MVYYITFKAPETWTRTVIYEGESYQFVGSSTIEVSSGFANYWRKTIKGTPDEQLFQISSKSDTRDLKQKDEDVEAPFYQEKLT